tara:strand:+ start:100 stop:498 length:399 start_codon:yes stop_codon:yes gene_type:complete
MFSIYKDMVYVYKYDEYRHQHLNKQLKTMFSTIHSIDESDVTKTMESLIGGYFSRDRLFYQLHGLFSRDNCWEYPDNEIIREYIYDFIVNDPVYLCGNLSNEEYIMMRNHESVGIFKKTKYIKKDKCPCLCV